LERLDEVRAAAPAKAVLFGERASRRLPAARDQFRVSAVHVALLGVVLHDHGDCSRVAHLRSERGYVV
jgi:hypothetical protein